MARAYKMTDKHLNELTHSTARGIWVDTGRRLTLDELYELNDALEAFLVAHDIDVTEDEPEPKEATE